jgi:DNA-binding NarL/FixJ family response regulator
VTFAVIEDLAADAGSFNTLIVEDNASFRNVLKDLLRRHFPFMTLDEARNGREAMEKLGDCDPELVFMDIKLPDANGLQLTQKFKQRCPHLTVIILTSYDYPEYRQAAEKSGADHFVSKEKMGDPFFMATIQSTLDIIRHLP